jgi:uncharacterized membrane protein YphA (DoxX/SURF4 family)
LFFIQHLKPNALLRYLRFICENLRENVLNRKPSPMESCPHTNISAGKYAVFYELCLPSAQLYLIKTKTFMLNSLFPVALRWIAAIILAQTLYFKFTGAEESVWIFQQLGVEPWGRLGSGVMELIAVILLILPRTAWLGALLGLGVISGAILSHLFLLGIEVKGDGGLLFYLALVVWVCCAVVLWKERVRVLREVR